MTTANQALTDSYVLDQIWTDMQNKRTGKHHWYTDI